jgi:Leucine-rich repeat (LRR) protein
MKTNTPKIISLASIREQFDLSQYDVINNIDKGNVIFFDGDTRIDGDLDADYVEEIDAEAVLVFVNGNLTVHGDIAIRDYNPWLLVIGNVSCDVLYSGDNTIHITGDADVTHAFYGYYNDGSITIEGTTRVPYVLNSDHHSAITPEGAVLINVYSEHNDFFDYDYTSEDLRTVLVKAALGSDGYVDAWKFIGLLRSGKTPFKKTARRPKDVILDEIKKITDSGKEVTELDLTEKRLKEFPASLTKLTKLRKLVLSENEIATLPESLGELVHLEELYVKSCDLSELPKSIGQLQQLRILDISGNYNLHKLPASFKKLVNLKQLTADQVRLDLPESFELPPNLEEISLYGSYKDINKFFTFPMALIALKHLKVLDLRENKFKELPVALQEIQSLEAFLWTGSRTDSDTFPDFTKFPHLKKLVISYKLLSWKEEVFNIPTLEHLEIDRNSEEKDYINQATIDAWLEMAKKEPVKFGHLPEIIANRKLEPDGRFSIIVNPGITPEDIQDLNKLPRLKYLDLAFNKLPYLPETIYELKALEFLDLRYNAFSEEEQAKIIAGFPGVKINFQS